jgi:hypothetical protein
MKTVQLESQNPSQLSWWADCWFVLMKGIEKSRWKVVSFDMAKIKWLYLLQIRLCNEISYGSLWPSRPINLLLMLCSCWSLLMLCFRVQVTLIFPNIKPDCWKSKHRNNSDAVCYSPTVDMLSSAWWICNSATLRSRRIISTSRLPEVMPEIKTVAHWILSLSIAQYLGLDFEILE